MHNTIVCHQHRYDRWGNLRNDVTDQGFSVILSLPHSRGLPCGKQLCLNEMEKWCKEWRVKANERGKKVNVRKGRDLETEYTRLK